MSEIPRTGHPDGVQKATDNLDELIYRWTKTDNSGCLTQSARSGISPYNTDPDIEEVVRTGARLRITDAAAQVLSAISPAPSQSRHPRIVAARRFCAESAIFAVTVETLDPNPTVAVAEIVDILTSSG